MAIITQLLGGLGNQMFQYAVGRRVALEHGVELLVDTSILEDHRIGLHEVNRGFDLDLFRLEVNAARPADRWRFNSHGLPFPVRAARKLIEKVVGPGVYRERGYAFDENVIRSPVPRYISGLWQSYRYSQPIRQIVLKDFSFRKGLSEKLQALANEISNKYSVVVHVRRGDYVTTASKIMFTDLAAYYRAAHREITKRLGANLKYFIFSDDIEWTREHFSWIGDQIVFVSRESGGGDPHIDFQLMAGGMNFIIANSTYAWWAAWLSEAPDKLVIAPHRWFQDASVDTSDLCPPDWLRL